MCSEGWGRSARDCPFVIAQIAGVLPRRVSFVPSQTLGTAGTSQALPLLAQSPLPPREQRCWLQFAAQALAVQPGGCTHLPCAKGYGLAGKLLINTVNLVAKHLVWAFLIKNCQSVPPPALFCTSLKC